MFNMIFSYIALTKYYVRAMSCNIAYIPILNMKVECMYP